MEISFYFVFISFCSVFDQNYGIFVSFLGFILKKNETF